MAATRLIIGAVLVAAALPASASAADVHVDGNTIVFAATPGEKNNVTVGLPGAPANLYVLDDLGAPLTAQAPYFVEEEGGVTYAKCPIDGIASVRLDLGDGDDVVMRTEDPPPSTSATLPETILGGDGNEMVTGSRVDDNVNGGPGADLLDGGPGNDTVDGGADVDQLFGGDGDDTVRGGDGNDSAGGGPGADTVDGGAGADDVSGAAGNDKLVGGAGIDTIQAGEGDDQVDLRDGEKENGGVRCDAGDDSVAVDPADGVAEYREGRSTFTESSCEHITGQPAPKPLHVFTSGTIKRGKVSITFDLVSAFSGTYTVKIKSGRKVVGGGKLKYGAAPRKKGKFKISRAFAKKARGGFVGVQIVVTNNDSAGRTSTSRLRGTLYGGPR